MGEKIYNVDPTSTTWLIEDRFHIVVDKNINFRGMNYTTYFEDGGVGSVNHGVVNLFKFAPAPPATTSSSRSAPTVALATQTPASASASRATPATIAPPSPRSRCKSANRRPVPLRRAGLLLTPSCLPPRDLTFFPLRPHRYCS